MYTEYAQCLPYSVSEQIEDADRDDEITAVVLKELGPADCAVIELRTTYQFEPYWYYGVPGCGLFVTRKQVTQHGHEEIEEHVDFAVGKHPNTGVHVLATSHSGQLRYHSITESLYDYLMAIAPERSAQLS